MGLYKLCPHKGRSRDRCSDPWWATFKGNRVSLPKWTNREIRTKDEADVALDDLKAAVRAGTFDKRGLAPTAERGPLTFAKFVETYAERHVKAKRGAEAAEQFQKWTVKRVLAAFGPKLLTAIKTAHIEDYITDLKKPGRVNKREGKVLSVASVNRELALLRHMFNWAVGREYLDRSPFKRGSETLIRLDHEDNKRTRRLTPDEEAALLFAAGPTLKPLIIFALDTGARRGEMLELTFADVDLKRGWVTFRGATTKSGKTRQVPIATQRLRAVLDYQRLDADGQQKPDTARVFSNSVGEPVKYFRTAWEKALARTTPRITDLRWHDLRHEYASRLAAKGVPLSQVRDLLGHASIVTTERYDTQTMAALQASAKLLETGATFTAPAEPTVPAAATAPTSNTVQ